MLHFFQPLHIGFIALAAITLAWGIWWIQSKTRPPVWMPILKILPPQNQWNAKIKWRRPRQFPFYLFTICMLALAFLSFRPYLVQTVKKPEIKQNILLFVDLSPSVSRWLSVSDLAKRIESISETALSHGHLYLSTSTDDSIRQIQTPQEARHHIQNSSYHAHGLIFTSHIQKILSNSKSNIDQFILVADGDEYSFSGVNWSYFDNSEQNKLTWIDIRDMNPTKPAQSNLYISSTKALPNFKKNYFSWEIQISRAGDIEQNSLGTLKLRTESNKILHQQAFEIKGGQTQVAILSIIEATKVNQEEKLFWQIEPSNQTPDAILLDNSANTSQKLKAFQTVIIEDMASEEKMSSATYHLRQVFELLGHQMIEKTSFAHLSKQQWKDSDVVISLIHHKRKLKDFCPAHLIDQKLPKESQKQIWLIPQGVQEQQYRPLCWCYANLTSKKEDLTKEIPSYCHDAFHRESFANLMFGLGASQFGGTPTERRSALAWISNRHSQTKVAAFSFPLSPFDPRFPVDPAQFAIFIKQVLDIQEQTNPEQSATKSLAKGSQQVPLGESLLRYLKHEDLPISEQTFKTDQPLLENALQAKQEPFPAPIIFIVIFILVLLSGAELFWWLTQSESVKKSIGFLLATWCFTGSPTKLHARNISIPFISSNPSLNLKPYATALENRTSITVDSETTPFFNANDPKILTYPWLWTDDISHLRTENAAKLKPKLAAWIKLGGFVVLENAPGKMQLEKLVDKSLNTSAENPKWRSIPIDHELMRSFYLLRNLPNCDFHQPWQGLYFKNRLAMIAIPYSLLRSTKSTPCLGKLGQEPLNRAFINLTMVVLTTDYKKDQIHIKEILKRIR